MFNEPDHDDLVRVFTGTNFGPVSDTSEGRKLLVADCVMKRACGFRSGKTIEWICKELGLLTDKGTPRKRAKMWAYTYIANQIAVDKLLGHLLTKEIERFDRKWR